MGTLGAGSTARIGIEKLRAYPATMALDMSNLCTARGMDEKSVRSDLLIDQRAVNPPWEDAVTMAVNAAKPMLSDDDVRNIGLLIVGTETSVDQEKPISSWVHHYLGLSPHCRNFEVKHACYGATSGVQMALAWLASGLAGDRKALVVSSDQSTIAIGEPWEPVTGAGAAAVLLSNQPRLIAYELGQSGIYASEVSDVIRPTPRVETGNSEMSLISYFDALEQAYNDYVEQAGGDVDFASHFAWNIYHMPFAGISYRAHRALMILSGDYSKEQTRQSFEVKSLPSTAFAKRTSGTYGASTFVGLLGLAATAPGIKAGDRVGIFAYGSGCCAEFQSAEILPEAADVAAEADMQSLLDARYDLSVDEYEKIERIRDESIMAAEFEPERDFCEDWYGRHYEGRGSLVLERIDGYYRHYGWS